MRHRQSPRSRAAYGALAHLAFMTVSLGAVTAWAEFCEARRRRRA